MRHRFLIALLAALGCASAAAQQAGRIDLVEGEVNIVDAGARPRTLRVGEAVHQGDTVTTGKDGEVHLKMEDGGMLAVRPQARMTIVRFRNTGRASDSSIISLARGALRAITGWIGRRAPEHVRIQTPTATIGIRGTDHEALVIPEGSSEGTPGTYDKVNAGGTRLRNRHGVADVSPGQAGFATASAAPQVLPSVPPVFQPRANDTRLEGLHESLQRAPVESRPTLPAGRQNGGQGKGSSGVSIQGNTNINATATNTNAVAIGQDNEASNKIGTIGGK